MPNIARKNVGVNTCEWRSTTPALSTIPFRFVLQYSGMERYHLSTDIRVFCVQAVHFPDGIRAAFLHLQELVDDMVHRDLFGIIYKNNKGQVVYKAAVTALPGEERKKGCESFILPSGEYLTEWLVDWTNNEKEINNKFSLLVADPRTDQHFPCIEWYEDQQKMLCMVKIRHSDENIFTIDQQTGLIRN